MTCRLEFLSCGAALGEQLVSIKWEGFGCQGPELVLRESLIWARTAGAGEDDNVRSKRLIKVKGEWFQADSEKQVSVL